ncbi:MAG: hypothetical protein FIA94_11745 [Nitrospirae bacterium]|nr:hypothetical protein [Nitrospirota bacterium]
MKKLIATMLALSLTIAVSGMAMAGTWDTKCIGCHKDGNALKAPTKDQLLGKYKSADALVKAGMSSKSPMMKASQKEDVLKEAATDLYK